MFRYEGVHRCCYIVISMVEVKILTYRLIARSPYLAIFRTCKLARASGCMVPEYVLG